MKQPGLLCASSGVVGAGALAPVASFFGAVVLPRTEAASCRDATSNSPFYVQIHKIIAGPEEADMSTQKTKNLELEHVKA